jgi:hypothetical protein
MNECERIEIKIYIAGDIDVTKQVVREFCFEFGWCVTVTPTTFIYSGGEEQGVIVGVENYPRFASDAETLMARAEELASRIAVRCCQKTYMICGIGKVRWVVRAMPFESTQ